MNPPANQGFPQVKQENPAIKAYNEGVDLMKAKKFAQAQAKFELALSRYSKKKKFSGFPGSGNG